MIAARQACFCEALRSVVIASSRPRTDRVIVMEIPVRMHQTRTATETGESQSGLFCQAKTTSEYLSEKLTPHPLPTKDGGVLRTVGDARGYILTLPKTRKSRAHWKRAS